MGVPVRVAVTVGVRVFVGVGVRVFVGVGVGVLVGVDMGVSVGWSTTVTSSVVPATDPIVCAMKSIMNICPTCMASGVNVNVDVSGGRPIRAGKLPFGGTLLASRTICSGGSTVAVTSSVIVCPRMIVHETVLAS